MNMRLLKQPQLFMGRRLISKPVRLPPSISNGISPTIQQLYMPPAIQLLGPPEIYVDRVPNDQNHQSSSSSSSGNPCMDLMVANFNKTEPLPLPLRISAENYFTTYYSCGNPCLDFFFNVVPYCICPDTLRYRLKLAWENDALTTLKLIYHLRSVRGTGKSDREGFYTAALWLHENHPKTLAHNIKWIPQFGSFKDLPEILYRILKGSDVRTVARMKQQRLKWKVYEDEEVFEMRNGSWVELAKDPSTDFEEIQRKFEESGYTVPEIVFWNLRDFNVTPVPSNQKGVALLSGYRYSKNMMTLFLEDEEFTKSEKYVRKKIFDPETIMESALSPPEYEQLVIVD